MARYHNALSEPLYCMLECGAHTTAQTAYTENLETLHAMLINNRAALVDSVSGKIIIPSARLIRLF